MNAGAGAFNQKLAGEIESELASAFAHHGVSGDDHIRRRRRSAGRSREGAQAGQARRDRRSRGRRRRRQHSHRRRRACRHGSTARRPSARHAQSFRQGSRNPFAGRGGCLDDRRRTCPRHRSCRGQRRDVHQQFLDRHLSLHGHRPRAAASRTQARQMDGYGAGVLPHAAAFPAPAIAHRGARALPSPTARLACSSATTNTAPSCSPSASESTSTAASSGSTW